MNKKSWIIFTVIIIAVILAVLGYRRLKPLYDENQLNKNQAEMVNKLVDGEQNVYNEYMYNERCIMFSDEMGYSRKSGELTVKSTMYIDDREGIDKVELKTAMEYDYIQYKNDYEEYILKTIDITDITLPDTSSPEFSSVGNYTKYYFDAKTTLTEADGFDIDRGMSYAVVITFNDGYRSTVFPPA